MAGEFTPETLEKTRLWQRLSAPFADEATTKLAQSLSQSVLGTCKIATDRMKLMPAVHGEFTLHDDTHLLRVTELMAKVLPDLVLEKVLNPVEITLLILAAHFHDVGMIPDDDEKNQLCGSDEYKVARENWLLEYSGFREAKRISEEEHTDPQDKARATAVLSDFESTAFARFLRDSHARRSSDFVKNRLSADDRLRVGTGHLADSLSLLCASHNWHPDQITEGNGFYYDKAVGTYPVNLAYLAMTLRLADILDFDRERTPTELYRCISFTNPISIQEWEKHRQVDGWKIDRDAVRFECACERPEYEQAIRQFLKYIDDELAAAHDLVRRFPKSAELYSLDLPARTDGSRIQAKAGTYLYASNLEISLSRDEIVRLLMTEKLYGHPSLAIRELLQNAWDALRYRKAIVMRDDGMDWTLGKVEFEHGVDTQGHEFVRCSDNGVGMDERIIRDFLVRAGRSYYRSPEFEQERLSFAKVHSDFDPCARFGIGFMSLFMLGDRITVETRRYRGSSAGMSPPLVVEINGVGGLIVLRRGPDSQPPGTTVTIVGRRKPSRFSTSSDRVQLTDTLFAYAVAGEFPVRGICTIPEIQDEISIPADIAKPPHPFIKFNVRHCVLFSQAFSEVDTRLQGEITCGVPLTETGKLAVCTSEAGWRHGDRPTGPNFWCAAGEKFQLFSWEGRTCLDGVLVAGPHGRGFRGYPLSGPQYRNPVDFGQDLFVLDVRGDLKPELNPDRSPPSRRGLFDDSGPSWRRLKRIAAKAHVRLWEKVLKQFNSESDAKALWQLTSLHRAHLPSMRRGFLWENLWVPSINTEAQLFFRRFSQIGRIPFGLDTPKPFACETDGNKVGIDEEMSSWVQGDQPDVVSTCLRETAISMGTLALYDGEFSLEFHKPNLADELGFTSFMLDRFSKRFPTMCFGHGLENVLAVLASNRVLNKGHSVITYLLANQETALDEPEFSFLHTLAGALIENGVLEALASGDYSNKHFNWHFSSLGYHFRRIDIAKLPGSLQPPYRCFVPQVGFFDITQDVLKSFSDIQAIDWHRHWKEKRE